MFFIERVSKTPRPKSAQSTAVFTRNLVLKVNFYTSAALPLAKAAGLPPPGI